MAGLLHTCALTTTGGVKCWGYNNFGTLGDGTIIDHLMPVDVAGLASGVVAIATGGAHTCALTTAGGVKCWGNNNFGQLGDSTTMQRLTPVDVSGLASGVTAIATGGSHTCALTTAGAVKCWGWNSNGELGDNTLIDRLTPVDVSGLASGVVAISATLYNTCALTAGGGVKCWGYNNSGQLGDNTTTQRLTPVDVSGLATGVTAIASGGFHTCALTTAGGMKCWGRNIEGQLGDETVVQRMTPVDVPDLASGVTAIVAGSFHTCALTTAGGVKCWGRNSEGQLGDISTVQRSTPVEVSGLAGGVAAIAAGGAHTCALSMAGTVQCWGANGEGQLGDNSSAQRLTPVAVPGLASGVTAIATGFYHTCALSTAGGMKCWGYNFYGQLGDNSTYQRLTPVAVDGLAGGVTAIATGVSHTCALTTGGGVKCWGRNFYGEVGDNSTIQRLTPVDVPGIGSGVAAITASAGHTCALTAAGGVKCWGDNGVGQLGDNSTTQRLTPVDVSGLANGVAAIATADFHTCALTTAGGVKCWGDNSAGQLGDNSTAQRLTPVDVMGLASGVTAIAAGYAYTCALTVTGGVKCWGYLHGGPIPVDVPGLASGVAAIATGQYHSCALTMAGGIKCWGRNSSGQLGAITNRETLIDVTGFASGGAAISAGGDHTCALTTAGGVKCWGDNIYGELGDGTAGIRPFPAPVLIVAAQVVEFYNINLDHYFITADASESVAIDNGSAGPGWSRTGNAFASGGNTMVCRFYGSQSPGPNSHFYALEGPECQGLRNLQFGENDPRRLTEKSWNFESFDFLSTPVIGGQCPDGTAPVYRAYNNGFARGVDSNHRISASQAAIAQVVARGWIYEGVVMCEPI